jgi:dihydroorotate dehydrogenase electron transfer subunit
MAVDADAGSDPRRPHRGTILLEDAEILANERYEGAQFVMRLDSPRIAARARPGSFVHMSCGDELRMRRPMSVMRTSAAQGCIDILFKAHGRGTALLAARRPGERLSLLGPIGKTFRLEGYRRRPLLIGGGVGIPPMIFLAEHMRALGSDVEPLVLMGSEIPFPFRARPSRILAGGIPDGVIAAMPLLDDWGIASRLASQQGYAGCYDGFVTDLARAWIERSGVERGAVEIFACGPTPMLRAVAALACEFSLPCEISLEEFMACAVGGCAGCTVRIETREGAAMKRVCVDGPVFDAASVVFQD